MASAATASGCWSRIGRDRRVAHARFADLPQFLAPGDLLVVNTSATLAAALPATREDGLELELRLSTPARGADSDGLWIVELRRGDAPFDGVEVGDRFELPGGATAQILEPYAGVRLWLARLDLPRPLDAYLAEHGQPIRYGYVPRRWPMSAYQNVYALEPGSAEMASAGRPFTAELITRLVAGGVLVAPVTLHAGVSSQERHERPYAERYRVPEQTARLVNAVRRVGRPRDRRRDDGRARARDRRRAGRNGHGGRGVDGARGDARARPLGDRRPAQRLSRVRSRRTSTCCAPPRARSCCAGATPPRSRTATGGTSSATAT